MGKRMSRGQKWGTLIWTFGPLGIEKKKKIVPPVWTPRPTQMGRGNEPKELPGITVTILEIKESKRK